MSARNEWNDATRYAERHAERHAERNAYSNVEHIIERHVERKAAVEVQQHGVTATNGNADETRRHGSETVIIVDDSTSAGERQSGRKRTMRSAATKRARNRTVRTLYGTESTDADGADDDTEDDDRADDMHADEADPLCEYVQSELDDCVCIGRVTRQRGEPQLRVLPLIGAYCPIGGEEHSTNTNQCVVFNAQIKQRKNDCQQRIGHAIPLSPLTPRQSSSVLVDQVSMRVEAVDNDGADLIDAQFAVALPSASSLNDAPWRQQIGAAVRNASSIDGTCPFRLFCDTVAECANVDEVVACFNERYASVLVEGTFKVMEPRAYNANTGHTHIKLMNRIDFVHFCAMLSFRSKPCATLWLSSKGRRSYDSVYFKPLRYGEAVNMETGGAFNTFCGWPCEPTPAVDRDAIKPILDFYRMVCANNNANRYEYILNWIAHCIQRPEQRVKTVLVMKGAEGSGKGTLCDTLRSLFHPEHFVHVQRTQHVIGNFNKHLADAQIVFCDEACWTGSEAESAALKGLITEPTLMVTPKGIDSAPRKFYGNFIIATNSKVAALTEQTARRFVMLPFSASRVGDYKYFERLHQAIADEYVRNTLFAFFLQRDISSFVPTELPSSPRAMVALHTPRQQLLVAARRILQ